MGSEFGGTYDNFYMAMWDPKGLMFRYVRCQIFVDPLNFFRGYLHVFVNTGARQQWCRWTTFTDVIITMCSSQRQRHLLRGPNSLGASSSCPSCQLSASSWLCSCSHGRGTLEWILPQQSIGTSIFLLLPILHIFTRPRCQKNIKVKWISKLVQSNGCFSFQLQATGNPSSAPAMEPPSYEKAVAWVQRCHLPEDQQA